jgi:hypothetical protein
MGGEFSPNSWYNATMSTAEARTWREYAEIANLFEERADPDWDTDRKQAEQVVRDPWVPR